MYIFCVSRRRENGQRAIARREGEGERYLSAVNYCSSKRYHGAGVTANYIFPDRQFTQLGSRISTQLAAKSIPKYSTPFLLKSNSSRIIDPHTGNHNNVLIESGEWLSYSITNMEILSKKLSSSGTTEASTIDLTEILETTIVVSKLRVRLSLKAASYAHNLHIRIEPGFAFTSVE